MQDPRRRSARRRAPHDLEWRTLADWATLREAVGAGG
jgi:hypothetical protein